MVSWLRLSHLVQWTKGNLLAAPPLDPSIARICTDTRSLKPGDLFLALKGEKYDANDFLDEAVKRGAAFIIASRTADLGVPLLLVPDTLVALIAIGESLRDRFRGTVIGVTGSAGKSSTKEMIATLLGEHTVASPASFNNLMGVSRTLFLVEDSTRNLVLEMGMNAFGEIKELCERFKPHAGLITNIGDAHIGKLGGQRGIFRAKKEMFDYLATNPSTTRGIALNVDDPLVQEAATLAFSQTPKTVSYSAKGAPADVRVLRCSLDPATGFLDLALEVRGTRLETKLPIFGAHQAQNIAASFAILTLLGHEISTLIPRLKAIRPASHRGVVLSLAGSRVLIDESYNSNPSALTSALESLLELDPARRRFLILGDMRELGDFSEKLHAEVGERFRALLEKRPFPLRLLGVGTHMAAFCAAMGQGDVVPTHAEATLLVKKESQTGDILFVKGSRGIGLDQLVEAVSHAFPCP